MLRMMISLIFLISLLTITSSCTLKSSALYSEEIQFKVREYKRGCISGLEVNNKLKENVARCRKLSEEYEIYLNNLVNK